ncbi:MAG: tetratricopeptide (TPR) repeat protein [Reinekea sp.]|jgi:tetratricopeptide (TPR) repeat protein
MLRALASLGLPILILSHCASFHAQLPNVAQQVEIWVADRQYDKALATIAQLAVDHPDYPSLTTRVPELSAQREVYVAQILTEALAFATQGDWLQAERSVDIGLKKLPDNLELQDRKATYQERRDERIKQEQAYLLLAQARYLIATRAHRETLLYYGQGGFLAQRRFSAYLKESARVANELYQLGQSYWQHQRQAAAKEALNLSLATAPDSASALLLSQILDVERTEREASRLNRLQQAQQQLPELQKSFAQQLAFEDFSGAQRVLDEIESLGLADVSTYQQQLRSQKNTKLAQLITSGNALYNGGYIEAAIAIWRQALQLNPNNQTIAQQLQRAETFLDNLKRWDAPTSLPPATQ